MTSEECFTILAVCTGNVCRSPAIELLLRQQLGPHGTVRVHSAGTRALIGERIAAHTRDLLEEAGVDTSQFRARQLTGDLIDRADLVLTATRDQRSVVVQLVPSAVRRTLTFLEFVRLLPASASERSKVDVTSDGHELAGLLRAVQDRRGTVPIEGMSDDIANPTRNSRRAHKKPLAQIVAGVNVLTHAMSPEAVVSDNHIARPGTTSPWLRPTGSQF